jgi:hypothetical protein
MPIDIQVRHAAIGVIYHCHGAVTIKDYFEAGNTFLATPDEIKKWRYAIIDLTSVESMDMNFNEVASVVQQNNRIAANAPKGVLVAVSFPFNRFRTLSQKCRGVWVLLSKNLK